MHGNNYLKKLGKKEQDKYYEIKRKKISDKQSKKEQGLKEQYIKLYNKGYQQRQNIFCKSICISHNSPYKNTAKT